MTIETFSLKMPMFLSPKDKSNWDGGLTADTARPYLRMFPPLIGVLTEGRFATYLNLLDRVEADKKRDAMRDMVYECNQ